MSKLDELIQKLCPDGVEFKTLRDVATVTRGGNFQKKDYCEEGFPCIHYGQIYTQYGLFTDKTLSFIGEEVAKKQKIATTNDIIMAVTSENVDDVCKCVAWLGDGEVAVSGHTAIIHHTLNAKYLTYYFHTEMFAAQKRKLAHGTKVIEVTPNRLNDVKIPVPPLGVQREIVRILDNFTELAAELTAELTARKLQYEHYRDELLSGNKDVEMHCLEELCGVITTGKLNANAMDENGLYPFFTCDAKPFRINTYAFDATAILVSGNGSQVGHINFYEGKFNAYQRTYVLFDFKGVNVKYLLHYLKAYLRPYINVHSKKGSVPYITMPMLNNFMVPVPSEFEQQRIVDILDRFDTLCNDISAGLPAEIEARQKQYEYYRDKLLTFKELV